LLFTARLAAMASGLHIETIQQKHVVFRNGGNVIRVKEWLNHHLTVFSWSSM
jgi:hypothetical protein